MVSSCVQQCYSGFNDVVVGSIMVSSWFQSEHDCPWNATVYHCAARGGHLDAVQATERGHAEAAEITV